MDLRDVRLLYVRELRAALRERGIVVGSILIPLLMYPVMLWLAFTAITFIRGQEERFVSRIALVDLPAAHEGLRAELLGEEELVELVDPPAPGRAEEAIAGGELDALAELLPAAEAARSLPDNFRLRVTYDASKDRSDKASKRVIEALDAYRGEWVRREAEAVGVGDDEWQQFRLERRDLSTSGEKGAFILGLMVPLLMIVMIAVGCFYPAVDATAGERERSTWETLMTVAASRTSVVAAKYLYVATLGGVAGLLNLFALTLTMRAILTPLMGDEAGALRFDIPWSALPLMALAAVLLAMFIAAGMMLFASFARTFKEGQSMVSPFYMLCILPVLFVQSPDLVLDAKLAVIPIVNVAMLFREAIAGTYNWPMIGLTLLVEALTVAACLALARWVLSFEDVLIGSYSGSLGKLLKERLPGRRGRSFARERGS